MLKEKENASPIVLAGSGRSGTSWLLNILTLDYNYRAIFEPFNWLQIPIASKFYNLYLTSSDEYPELEKFMRQVFYYKTDEAWARWMHFGIGKKTPLLKKTLQYIYNLPKYKFWAKNRVVKIIKGNLMLSWLQKHFNAKIVYIIRHPCAVIDSQRRMGWDTRLTRFLSQPKLISDYLHPYLDFIYSAKTETEKLAILWCIENFVPLQQIKKGEIKAFACTYEHIICEPEKYLEGIMSFLGFPLHIIKKNIIKMKRKMPPNKNNLQKWRFNLNKSEINYILNAVKHFGINIYNYDYLPIKGIKMST